jgi:hypothetical protein
MRKYLTQMLDEINTDPSKVDSYKDDFLLKVISAHAFLEEYKMILPEGEPPFKPAAEPMGMTPTNLFNECKRFYVFCRKDLTSSKRESLFISLLEGIHPDEAKVLIALKDQNLGKLYPKITHQLVGKAGIIPYEDSKPKKQKQSAKAS